MFYNQSLTRHKIQAATILTGLSVSTAVNIQGFEKIAIEIPTFEAGLNTLYASVRAQVCQTSGGTFRQLWALGVNSAYSGMGQWEVPSGLGNAVAVCSPVAGFNYIKVEIAGTNASATAAALMCNVHCFE